MHAKLDTENDSPIDAEGNSWPERTTLPQSKTSIKAQLSPRSFFLAESGIQIMPDLEFYSEPPARDAERTKTEGESIAKSLFESLARDPIQFPTRSKTVSWIKSAPEPLSKAQGNYLLSTMPILPEVPKHVFRSASQVESQVQRDPTNVLLQRQCLSESDSGYESDLDYDLTSLLSRCMSTHAKKFGGASNDTRPSTPDPIPQLAARKQGTRIVSSRTTPVPSQYAQRPTTRYQQSNQQTNQQPSESSQPAARHHSVLMRNNGTVPIPNQYTQDPINFYQQSNQQPNQQIDQSFRVVGHNNEIIIINNNIPPFPNQYTRSQINSHQQPDQQPNQQIDQFSQVTYGNHNIVMINNNTPFFPNQYTLGPLNPHQQPDQPPNQQQYFNPYVFPPYYIDPPHFQQQGPQSPTLQLSQTSPQPHLARPMAPPVGPSNPAGFKQNGFMVRVNRSDYCFMSCQYDTLCLRVYFPNGIIVCRRLSDNMINGTKMMRAITNMSNDEISQLLRAIPNRANYFDSQLRELTGVWIPYKCAYDLVMQYGSLENMFPLLVFDWRMQMDIRNMKFQKSHSMHPMRNQTFHNGMEGRNRRMYCEPNARQAQWRQEGANGDIIIFSH